FHSARWDVNEKLEGKRVAVIGTGASAIQIVPSIQPDVAQLHVFQRTPPWVLPHSQRPVKDVERTVYRRVPATQRAVRALVSWSREPGAPRMTRNPRKPNPAPRTALR